MKIYYHKIIASAMQLTQEDIDTISYLCNVPLSMFQDFTAKSGTRVLSWKPTGATKEAIGIAIPKHALYGTIKLQGEFFNQYPDFPMHKFWQFLKAKQGNVITADISFEDDQSCLDFAEIRRCCLLENYQDYITGLCLSRRKKKNEDELPDSNNRDGIPDVHTNHPLIHLGNVGATMPCKIYARDTVKVEITINDKDHNAALLDLYHPDTIDAWEQQAKAALVKCINFVRPASKRAKRLVKLDWWQAFLAGDVKPIRWTDTEPEQSVVSASFDDALKRGIARLQNIAHKFSIHEDMTEAIAELEKKFLSAFNALHEFETAAAF